MYKIFETLCNEHGVTPYRVCKDTGITTATISNWKAGRYVPKADKLQKIADYFKVSATYLLENEESYYRFFGDLYEIANGKISQTAKPLSPDGAPRETISETEASPA